VRCIVFPPLMIKESAFYYFHQDDIQYINLVVVIGPVEKPQNLIIARKSMIKLGMSLWKILWIK